MIRRFSLILMALMLILSLACTAGAEKEPDWTKLAVKDGTLVGAAYSCSGDEEGNVYYALLTWTQDATLVLELNQSPNRDEVVTVKRYSMPDDTLERIAAIVNQYDMLSWSKRPDYYDVCDAAHPYLHLTVLKADGTRVDYDISGYIAFEDDESDAFDDVSQILQGYAKANLIETYQMDRE